jgi:hypothetical protein
MAGKITKFCQGISPLAVFLFCISCNKPTAPISEDFSYPLGIGDKWEYGHTLTVTNYRVPVNDSVFVSKDTVIPSDSSRNYVSVVQADSTTLPVATLVVRDSAVTPGDTQYSVGRSWYRNAADGLYKCAIDFPGGPQASPKAAAGAKALFRFKGRLFLSLREISDLVTNGLSAGSTKRLAAVAGATVLDPPRLSYRYPYKAGTMWDFNNSTDSILIAKQYLGKESITTPAGTFECYKVEWFWDSNHDGVWDADQEGYDWISPNHGLVKRQFLYRDMEETSLVNNNTLVVVAKFDWVDEYTLTSVRIP